MLGVVLTLLAGLAVICFAFCYSDTRGFKADVLFYLTQNRLKRKSKSAEREDPRDFNQIVNRKS